MKSKRLIYGVIGLLILALLFPLQKNINRLKQERDLIETANIFEAITPGDVWGIILLAGFRGIAVNMLWMRAMDLQQEGKFLELLVLHRLILQLQPHFLPVWAFSAWNMAYNICHDAETLEEKWAWIQKGIATLEKGIRRNPKHHRLYFELGWIYFHKCAAREAENYYIEQLAQQGKNNFELAAYWFEKATQRPPYPKYIDAMTAHAYGKRAEQAAQAGQARKAEEFTRRALVKWRENVKKYPEDEVSRRLYTEWKNKLSAP